LRTTFCKQLNFIYTDYQFCFTTNLTQLMNYTLDEQSISPELEYCMLDSK